jgi:D-3-phosphoglycerate dehydrogenase
MIDSAIESLICDLVEWVAKGGGRPYEEVMDAWRTSCPRYPVWEDASDLGLVKTECVDGRWMVRVDGPGMALLERRRASEYAAVQTRP